MRLAVILIIMMFAVVSNAQVLPVEHFANLPDTSKVNLSPDGSKIVSLQRVDNKDSKGQAVVLYTPKNNKQKILLFSDNSKYFIYRLQWKDNEHLLIHTYYPDQRDTYMGLGQVKYDSRETRLLIVNVHSGEVRTPFTRAFLKQFRYLPSELNEVIDTLPEDPDHILMELPLTKPRSEGDANSTTVYKVNIKNKSIKIVQESMDYVAQWQTDRQHKIRLAHRYENGITTILIKSLATDKWQALWSYKVFSADEVQVLGFGYDGNIVYISAYHDNRKAIFKVNLTDSKLNRELIWTDTDYDVDGHLIYNKTTKQVIGITSSGQNGGTFFTKKLQKLQAGIDKAMPNCANYIYAIADDLNSYLVYSTGPNESGTYYLGRRNPSSLSAISYRYMSLPPKVLAQVSAYNYVARDGLAIEGWLTLPKQDEHKRLATIIFPHGGPIARDSNSFDYWAQFFANRGYAVLQMNFRGSGGQGIDLRNLGLKDWGGAMQDDIEDGAKKLIADGITDANKICIVGASYGGYAALMGAVKTPDFYQCAISVAGVSDVFELVRSNRSYWRSFNIVDEQIGELGTKLNDISPVNHAKAINIPILLIHGDSDRQVDVEHSQRMYQQLKAHDKSVRYVELPKEDHYLSNEANRLATFKAMDSFLKQHLPVTASK